MRLRFLCLVHRLLDGRTTVACVEHADLVVHAADEEAALEEAKLLLTDRVERSHPAALADLLRYRPTVLSKVELHIVPWVTSTTLATTAGTYPLLRSRAHGDYDELRLPTLGLRYWISRKGPTTKRLRALVKEQAPQLAPSLRLEGRWLGELVIEEVAVDAVPLSPSELTPEELRRADALLPHERRRAKKRKGAKRKDRQPPPATPTLDQVGLALHRLADEGELPAAHGVEARVEALRDQLLGPLSAPVVLVGPSGVGKTALVQELVRRLSREDVAAATLAFHEEHGEDEPTPQQLAPFLAYREHRVYLVDGPRLIAGTGGGWDATVHQVIAEAKACAASLHLGRVLDLLDAGKSAFSQRNVSQVLGPALLRRDVYAVGEATPEEWAKVEMRNRSFARCFRVVRVTDPAPDELVEIVRRRAADRSALALDEGAVDAIVQVVRRYRPYGSALGQCVAFLERLAAAVERERGDGPEGANAGPTALSRVDVVRSFAAESGLPEALLRDDQTLDQGDVAAFLRQQVVAQDDAVERVAAAVTRLKAGLSDPNKPVATLLFAGPTGVGKTQLAKALATYVFGDESRLLRLDMGEYGGGDAIQRFVGPAGRPGPLVAAVRRQPFQVVLLDEIEKAHPLVFDALLGVLGEGRLTDGDGKTADFRSAIIVMTSNLGAQSLRPKVGFGESDPSGEAIHRHYRGEIERFFRPELFNRIDDIVVFGRLEGPAIERIVSRELALLRRRQGFSRVQASLEVDDAAEAWLAAQGTDPRYGARPLKRCLERSLTIPAARAMTEAAALDHAVVAASVGEHGLTVEVRTGDRRHAATRHRLSHHVRDAVDLRRSVHRVDAGAVVAALRAESRSFARASKNKSFWAGGDAARQKAHEAARVLEALKALDEHREQTEQAEELAVQAYLERDLTGSDVLQGEVTGLRQRLPDVELDLFVAEREVQQGVTLYLAPRDDDEDDLLSFLVGHYERYLSTLGLQYDVFRGKLKAERIEGRKKPAMEVRWLERRKATESLARAFVAITVAGDHRLARLRLEHGTHVMKEGVESPMEVSVVYAPARASRESLWTYGRIRRESRGHVVRRVDWVRFEVHDTRLAHSFPARSDSLVLDIGRAIVAQELRRSRATGVEWSS